MKTFPLLLGAIFTLMLGGCQTTGIPQTEGTQFARQLIIEQCMVGKLRLGSQGGTLSVREGVVSDHSCNQRLNFRHNIQPGNVTIFSVDETHSTWTVVDASTQGVRDNFYINRSTGEAVCSQREFYCKLNSWR